MTVCIEIYRLNIYIWLNFENNQSKNSKNKRLCQLKFEAQLKQNLFSHQNVIIARFIYSQIKIIYMRNEEIGYNIGSTFLGNRLYELELDKYIDWIPSYSNENQSGEDTPIKKSIIGPTTGSHNISQIQNIVSSISFLNKCPTIQQVTIFNVLRPSNEFSFFKKYIFKQGNYHHRNKNFTKFIKSNFFIHIKDFQEILQKQYISFLQKTEENISKNGIRNIKLEALEYLFGMDQKQEQYRRMNRRILHRLLGSEQFKEDRIFSNASISEKNKKNYLLATKVHRLRCRNSQLCTRTEIK